MFELLFLTGYLLSFDAMVASFIPGTIALLSSSTGLLICACRLIDSNKKVK